MANKTQWTPGPWRVDATKGLPVMIRGNVPAGKPSAVAQIMRDRAWEADANLIAAATEMFESLRQMFWLACTSDFGQEHPAVMELARAALAKAEGR